WQTVQTPLNDLLNGIRNIFNQIKNNIIQPIIDKINEFAGTIRNVLEQLGLVQSQAQITQTALNNVANHPGRAVTNSPALFGRANGMEFVPFNQNVRVHRGEAILTAEQNEARLNGEMGQVNNTFTIQINAPMTKAQADETASNMISALRNRGIQLSRA